MAEEAESMPEEEHAAPESPAQIDGKPPVSEKVTSQAQKRDRLSPSPAIQDHKRARPNQTADQDDPNVPKSLDYEYPPSVDDDIGADITESVRDPETSDHSPDPSSDEEKIEAFGQSINLIDRIHELCRAYPMDSIVNETLQNADDARATRVNVCLDLRQLKTDSFVAMGLKPFMGPALCIFNDGKFSDTDFKNIRNIDRSLKGEDRSTTGRYGQGFNSVYHLTDLPSLVSGDCVCAFDPHHRFFPGATAKDPGGLIRFTSTAGSA